jgi:tetratricopeptide (TPR) repeat protein
MGRHKRPQANNALKSPGHESQGDPDDLLVLRRRLRLEPGNPELWAIFGGRLLQLNRLGEAKNACHTALHADAGNLAARYNLGLILMELGQLDESEGQFRRVLAVDPGLKDARMALSECLFKKNDLGRAYQNLTGVLRLNFKDDPASPRAANELGLLDLLFGKMPEGWDGHEARLKIPGQIGPVRNFPQPSWNGLSFTGKSLLLHYEQGFGDTLMFLRYVPKVKALGGQVILTVQRPLADLAATCPGVDGVIPHGDALPAFDIHLSLASLPWAFRTDLNSIPAEIPYLDVPAFAPHRSEIASVLAASEGKTRVGIVWAGNPGYKIDAARSIPRDVLAPLSALPGVAWHSFQLGELAPPDLPGLCSLAPMLSNFSDTAYGLSGMDLLITVDTAIAHLAGALGIPTLILIPFFPDWRWLLGRDDSPWYPTMRIYRQTDPGDWRSVIQRVVTDLTQDS